MRRFRQVLTICLAFAAALTYQEISFAGQPTTTHQPNDETLDTSPIRDLLGVLITIKEENPEYSAILEGLRHLAPRAAEDSLAVLVDRNAHNPRIVRAVDALLASPGYQLCFKQFTNINPDWYRKFLYALPYRAVDGPGGVGYNLYELFQHQDEVELWYEDVVRRVDVKRCIEVAKQWLPAGDYEVPKTYFIYDGNGGAFANNGKVGFDLFSELLQGRPQATRFENLDGIGTEEIERVLAHEYHHIFAYELLIRSGDESAPWEERTKNSITDQLIWEGMALQCNSPEGLKKEIWEDTMIARYWVGELNTLLRAMGSGQITKQQVGEWRSDSFFGRPTQLLRGFLMRRFPGVNQDSLTTANMVHRPDLEHMLGAWMVSHISDGGKNREKVIQLLSQPDSLFNWYNTAIGTGDSTLLVRAKSE